MDLLGFCTLSVLSYLMSRGLIFLLVLPFQFLQRVTGISFSLAFRGLVVLSAFTVWIIARVDPVQFYAHVDQVTSEFISPFSKDILVNHILSPVSAGTQVIARLALLLVLVSSTTSVMLYPVIKITSGLVRQCRKLI